MADLQRTVYPHSGHPSSEGRAQDSVSSPAKDRRSANCATQPTVFGLWKTLTLYRTCLGKTTVARACVASSQYTGSMKCTSSTVQGYSAEVCYCDSGDYCNAAVMTSPFGHVIMVVAVLISVVIGQRM